MERGLIIHGTGNGDAIPSHVALPRPRVPLAIRFLDKFILDVLPAALASVIGGFLFAQYHAGHAMRAATEQVTPASAEMMAMVRDEHAMMMDYLKAQMAAEKGRAAAQDAADARAAADAKAMEAGASAPAAEAAVAQAAVVRQTAPRAKKPASVAVAVRAPLVIAQADQTAADQNEAPAQNRLASDPDSLLARTLDLKDEVVAAAGHVVSAIGNVFTSVGEHIGGGNTVRQYNS